MPAINFKPRFADLILSGKKRTTIRHVRKPPIKAFDTLTLYTGMRTKECRKLMTCTCIGVTQIVIDCRNKAIDLFDHVRCWYEAKPRQIEYIIKADGFDDPDQFFFFFAQQYPVLFTPGSEFVGVLIQWEPPVINPETGSLELSSQVAVG